MITHPQVRTNQKSSPTEFVVDGNVQYPEVNAHISVANRVAHLGQCRPPAKAMADKRVPPMMNRQAIQPF